MLRGKYFVACDVIEEYGQAVYYLVLKLMAILSQEVGQAPDYYTPHTYWCGLVNREYQHWLQPVPLTG